MKSIVKFSKEVVKRLFFGGGAIAIGVGAIAAVVSWSSLYVVIAAALMSFPIIAGGVILFVGGVSYLLDGEEGLG